jgi:hypothetical protein
MQSLFAGAAVSVALMAGTDAQAWVIDFEQFGNADVILNAQLTDSGLAGQIPGAGPGVGVSIFADNYNVGPTQSGTLGALGAANTHDTSHLVAGDVGVIFDTNDVTNTADTDLWVNFVDPFGGGPSLDPGNILIIQDDLSNSGFSSANPAHCGNPDGGTCQEPDDEGNQITGQMILEFTTDVFLESLNIFDIENNENNNNENTEILLYDQFNNLLASIFTPDTGGDSPNTYTTVQLNQNDVRLLVVEFKGSGGIDDIRGDTDIPEPATLGLFSAGLVGVGWMRRRRQNGTR